MLRRDESEVLLAGDLGVTPVALARIGGGIEETDSRALAFTTRDEVDAGIADICIGGRDTCLGGFGSAADRVCSCVNATKYQRGMNVPFLASFPLKSRFDSHSDPSRPSFLCPCGPPSL